MKLDDKQDVIDIWRTDDLPQLEVRRGYGVARPVPRHWHEEYQFCLILSGPGEMRYRGRDLPTPVASLFMVHPGEVHSNRHYDSAGCSYRALFVDTELMRRAAAEVHGKEAGLPFFPTAVVFDQELVRRYMGLHISLERPSSSLERESLLMDFLASMIVRFAEQRPRLGPPGSEHMACRRACDYLVEHYAENVSLESLARIANLSPFHFNRVFSEQFGMPPHAFQTQMRVVRAKSLLLEGWPIPQVASQTGFADQSHLTRHFKRLAGVTPGRYAQNSKNVQDGPHPPR